MDENINIQNTVNEQPVYTATPAEDNSTKTLIFGIIAIVLSELGLLGLIFAILGKKEAKKYEQNFGALTGKAKVGAILSKVALILSIVMAVVYVFCFFVGMILGFLSVAYA